jgi:hypothetical protein
MLLFLRHAWFPFSATQVACAGRVDPGLAMLTAYWDRLRFPSLAQRPGAIRESPAAPACQIDK